MRNLQVEGLGRLLIVGPCQWISFERDCQQDGDNRKVEAGDHGNLADVKISHSCEILTATDLGWNVCRERGRLCRCNSVRRCDKRGERPRERPTTVCEAL